MKGSQIKSKAEQVELNRLLAEFSEKLETDPYQPGIVHPHLCSDDLQDVIQDSKSWNIGIALQQTNIAILFRTCSIAAVVIGNHRCV